MRGWQASLLAGLALGALMLWQTESGAPPAQDRMTLPLPPPPASEATAVIVPVLLAYLDQLVRWLVTFLATCIRR